MPDKRNTLPSVEYLLQCFVYDPDTGVLVWKDRPQGHFRDMRTWKWWNA